jgi:hypothetical protein
VIGVVTIVLLLVLSSAPSSAPDVSAPHRPHVTRRNVGPRTGADLSEVERSGGSRALCRNGPGELIDGGLEINLKSGDKSAYKVTISAMEGDDQCSLESRARSNADVSTADNAIFTVASTV